MPALDGSSGRGVRISRLHQAIDRLLLHPVGFRGGQFLVQFVQLGSGDVLLFVDAQNFVFFLVLHQFFLRGLDLHLQIDQLLRQPVGGLHGGLKAGLEVLLDVGADQGIYDAGGEILVGAAVVDFDDSGIGNQSDPKTALKSCEQGGGLFRVRLQRIGGEAQRVWMESASPPPNSGLLVEIQLLDHLQGQQIALQNSYFGIEVGGIVVVRRQCRSPESLKFWMAGSVLLMAMLPKAS